MRRGYLAAYLVLLTATVALAAREMAGSVADEKPLTIQLLTLDRHGNVRIHAPVEVLVDRAGDGPIPGLSDACVASVREAALSVSPDDAVLCLKGARP